MIKPLPAIRSFPRLTAPRIAFLVFATIILPHQLSAAILVTGTDATFTGPGDYSFDLIATADGSDEMLAGFQVPLSIAAEASLADPTPGGDVTFNPAFDLPTVNPIDGGFGLAGISFNAGPLDLIDGESAVLATLTFNVASDLTGPITVATVADENLLDFLVSDPTLADIPVTFGGGFNLVPVAAIPEPSCVFVLASAAPLMVRRRRATRADTGI